jgi:transposase
MRKLRPEPPADPVVRFDTAMGEQLQVDWVELRKGSAPLPAFCATQGLSRSSYVEFVSNIKVETPIACQERAFVAFGGATRRVLHDACIAMAILTLLDEVHERWLATLAQLGQLVAAPAG